MSSRPRAILFPVSVYLVSAAVVTSAFLLTESAGIPFVALTRDAAVAHSKDAPMYGGFLSNLGAMLWTSAAAVCFFAALTNLRSDDPEHHERRAFLLTLGALTALLLIDDLFMVHELILKHFGRSQKATLLVQGALAVWMLWRFRKLIRQSDLPLLLSSGLLFAGSLVIDLELVRPSPRWQHVLEDGLKFLGIAGWCGYALRTCTRAVRSP
jgi:hypothetical protein